MRRTRLALVLGALLAVLAGLMWAVGVVLLRKGLSSSDYFSSAAVVTIIGNLIFWPIVLVLSPKSPFNVYGFLVLALAGLLHPGLVRLLYYLGISRVGVSVNASIYATYSLFGSLFAILLLNEQSTIILWLGIVSAVVGAVVIQFSVSNENAAKSTKSGLLIPASASVTAGLSYVLKKMGLNFYGEPIVGVAMAYLISLILYALMFTISPKVRSQTSINSHTFKLFWKTGLCDSIGFLLLFYAFEYGDVTMVTPLLQVQPLFILLLSYFYLRKIETLSKKLVLGTILIVLGIVLATAFKG